MSLVGSIDLVTYIIRMDQVLRLPREIPLCLKGWEVLSPAPTDTGTLISTSQKLSPLQEQRPIYNKHDQPSNPSVIAHGDANNSTSGPSAHISCNDSISPAIDARSATSQVSPGLEDQRYSESDIPRLRQSMEAPVYQISPAPGRVVGGTPSCERLASIAEPPRRKSFTVAQARISEERNQRRRHHSQELDVVRQDRQPGSSEWEECPRLPKRRKRGTQFVAKSTNHASSAHSLESLPSPSSVPSTGSCSSQDIFGHAILTIETHGSEMSYYFSFTPSTANEANALPLPSSFNNKLGHSVGPVPTREAKNIRKSRKRGRYSEISVTRATNETSNTIKEQEWEVRQILASRISRGKLQYQVQWKGCGPDHTWYPAHGFKGAPYKIQNFHGVFPDQPGPPKRLAAWLESWESGQDLEDIPDDDLPE